MTSYRSRSVASFFQAGRVRCGNRFSVHRPELVAVFKKKSGCRVPFPFLPLNKTWLVGSAGILSRVFSLPGTAISPHRPRGPVMAGATSGGRAPKPVLLRGRRNTIMPRGVGTFGQGTGGRRRLGEFDFSAADGGQKRTYHRG